MEALPIGILLANCEEQTSKLQVGKGKGVAMRYLMMLIAHVGH
jgi:hypothetical protein